MIPTGKTLAEMEVELARMMRALDELTESVAIMREEIEFCEAMDDAVYWPDYQSEKLRASLGNWAIWVPMLRALDIELNHNTRRAEECQ